MDFKVSITSQAEEDFADIYSYILNEFKSPINADALLNTLFNEIQALSYMADGYHLYPKEPWFSRGIRYFSIKNYSIFYLIKEDKEQSEVRVTRVSNGRRDLDRVLSEMKID